jgi:hypothetical protein
MQHNPKPDKMDPYVFIHNYMHSLTNLFILSIVGLLLLSHNSIFKSFGNIFKTISILILLYCMMYGFKIVDDFKDNIKILKKNDIDIPYHKRIGKMEDWIYLTYFYLIIIALITAAIFIKN